MNKFLEYCNKNKIEEGQIEKLEKLNKDKISEINKCKEQLNKQKYLLNKMKKADKLIEERKWMTQ